MDSGDGTTCALHYCETLYKSFTGKANDHQRKSAYQALSQPLADLVLEVTQDSLSFVFFSISLSLHFLSLGFLGLFV
jgi:hypothetical protein